MVRVFTFQSVKAFLKRAEFTNDFFGFLVSQAEFSGVYGTGGLERVDPVVFHAQIFGDLFGFVRMGINREQGVEAVFFIVSKSFAQGIKLKKTTGFIFFDAMRTHVAEIGGNEGGLGCFGFFNDVDQSANRHDVVVDRDVTIRGEEVFDNRDMFTTNEVF